MGFDLVFDNPIYNIPLNLEIIEVKVYMYNEINLNKERNCCKINIMTI